MLGFVKFFGFEIEKNLWMENIISVMYPPQPSPAPTSPTPNNPWKLGTFEPSDFWSFGFLNLRTFEPSEFWTFGLLNFRNFGPSEYWTFGILDLRNIEPSEFWTFGILNLRNFGPSEYWTFGILDGYRINRLWRRSFLELIGVKTELFVIKCTRYYLDSPESAIFELFMFLIRILGLSMGFDVWNFRKVVIYMLSFKCVDNKEFKL